MQRKYVQKSNSNLASLMRLCVLLVLGSMLMSCASLPVQKPQVSLLSISPKISNGLKLSFELELKVVNPNSVPLPVKSIDYALTVNGTQIADGVTDDVPTIPAKGEETIKLNVGVNWLSAPRLVSELMKNRAKGIDYELSGSVDLGDFLPSISINEMGNVPITF